VRGRMRALFALTALLLGLNLFMPERDASTLLGDYLHASAGNAAPSLFQIEASTARGDRLSAAVTQPHETSDQAPEVEADDMPLSTALLNTDIDPQRMPGVSLDNLCNALFTSAQDNDLPVPFFANLIWQESRLRDDAVSPVGALGIAQFMPRVAMASGLDNPFDPLQAIPASARLLRELRDQFGNLGFVAAAYNAGARRVSEWLEHRRALPRETLNYIIRVTGRSAEDWRKTPPDDTALTFVPRLPCRGLPAFADLEQAQLQEAQVQKAEAEAARAEAQSEKTEAAHASQQAAATVSTVQRHSANGKLLRPHARPPVLQAVAREPRGGKRQAVRVSRQPQPHETIRSARGKRSIEARLGAKKATPRKVATQKA
jgi:Transglycosylase SLT domain